MTAIRLTVPLLAALILAACGGGGGGEGSPGTPGNSTRPVAALPFPLLPILEVPNQQRACTGGCYHHYTANFETLPAPTPEDAQRAPIYSEGGSYRARVFVGVHQGDERIGALPNVGRVGDTNVRYGRLDDGAGAATVAAYLGMTTLDDGVVRRHASPPVLRVNGPIPAHYLDAVVRAVQLVNVALPDEWKITMVQSGDAGANIEVDIVPNVAEGAGITHYWVDHSDGSPSLDRARIEIDSEVIDYGPSIGHRLVQQVLAHELVHALGILEHLPVSFDTIMEPDNPGPVQGIPQPLSILYPADREALRALYGRLDNGDTPAADLGPWSSASTHLAGNGPHANFGVALRNGYVEAWAVGYHPGELYFDGRASVCCDFGLDDNTALTGMVEWNGEIFGFTPTAEAIVGDAAVSVNMTTMMGRADFTGLEAWAASMAPGDPGTGAQWLDGDLGYAIAVRGNTFRETGGDAGRLTGIFTGAAHEGAAGTLERSDLTAAFGASRE